MKTAAIKRSNKQERERDVLFGLIDYYIETGKPVGSNTLKESGFGKLSSATIRNYFSHLETQGYLTQPHISGGRIPTEKGYRLYASETLESGTLSPEIEEEITSIASSETKEIAKFLQDAAETLSRMTNTAVFLSAPRFDHDFIVDLKLVPIDTNRCLCILVSDFGLIRTETLHLDKKRNAFSLKRIEGYFHWRLTGHDKPENLEPEEEALAQKFYNEVMVRYIVGYSHFIDEELYRTGLAKLLHYPDFQDPLVLASSLALFENAHSMRLLLRECTSSNTLKFWIGQDLLSYAPESPNCSVLAAPYRVQKTTVGAIGLLGPMRLPFRVLFPLLRRFTEAISTVLTRNIYKYKITFRQPEKGRVYLEQDDQLLLEDKRQE